MKFKKLCTRVSYLRKADDGNWVEVENIFVGRVPKSKVRIDGVIQSVGYLKCDVEIPDAIVNQYANITEIEQ